jgi:hypothetical protein
MNAHAATKNAVSALKAHVDAMDTAAANPNLTLAQWLALIQTLIGLLGPVLGGLGGIFGGGGTSPTLPGVGGTGS